MKRGTSEVIAGAGALLLSGAATAQPDLIVADIFSPARFGESGGVQAYSFGVALCNEGDAVASWQASTPLHPVVTQNLYRLHEGWFTHIGRGWCHHEFCALQIGFCATCQAGDICSELGAGCATTSSSSVMGAQTAMGPRSDVDAAAGQFPYPFSNLGGAADVLSKRVQVATADLEAPGARFFAGTQVISRDDAEAGAGDNNHSYREVVVGPSMNLSTTGSTQRERFAVQAWADADAEVLVSVVAVPGGGVFAVASRTYDEGDGNWRYEYAVENLNVSRGAGGLAVPLPAGVTAGGVGFHDVDPHSGEVYDGADWGSAVGAGAVTWASPETFEENPLTNALRWGTVYSFWFTADAAPATAEATLTLFEPGGPGEPASVSAAVVAPEPASCVCDVAPGGGINSDDFFAFIAGFLAGEADLDGDGSTTSGDFFDFIACFVDPDSGGC